jgi:hypothetical protein
MEEVCQWTEARTFGMALSVAMKWMSPRVEALMVEKMRITNEEHGTMSIEWRVRNGEYEKRSMRWGAEQVEIRTTHAVPNIEESSRELSRIEAAWSLYPGHVR